jgi:O-antigen/teichoic acid export membrane protein
VASQLSHRSKVLHGGSVIVVGSLAWQVLRLVSSVFLARILGLEQFGLASMLLLVVGFIEMSSNVSIDKQLVQATDGDAPRFLDTSHAFSVIRGIVATTFFLCLAYPAAWLFGVPDYSWAFALLAIVPFCNGFSHLDRKRLQRHLRFAPDMVVEFAAQIASVVVVVSVAWWTRSFTAAAWAIVANSVVSLVVSFLVAERPYRWCWDKVIARRLVSFGWPLLLGAVLLFAAMHGERALLASAPRLFPKGNYSMSDLGLYAAAGSLAYAPMVVIGRLGLSLSLPILAEAKHSEHLFLNRFRVVASLLILSGLLMVISYYIMGPTILRKMYGTEFGAGESILLSLAVAQAIRMVRIAPTVGALALGNSRIAMWADIVRVFGSAAAIWVFCNGWPVVWLAITGALAELWTLVFSSVYFWKMLGVQQSYEIGAKSCSDHV